MADLIRIIRENILNELVMGFKQINPNDSIVKLFFVAVNFFKVHSVFVSKKFQSNHDKFKESFQVQRRWSSDKNITKS